MDIFLMVIALKSCQRLGSGTEIRIIYDIILKKSLKFLHEFNKVFTFAAI